MPVPRHRRLTIASIMLVAATAVNAAPWLDPGDVRARHSLQKLADRGHYERGVTTWPVMWVDVDNGNQLQFQEDGKFNSDRFKECSEGLFRINGNELLLQYTCDDFKPKNINDEGFVSYHIEYKSDHFILKPTSGPICIEGCSYKYRRQ